MLKYAVITALLCSLAIHGSAQPGDIPNAQPGRCYAKCLVHDKYEMVTEQVMLKEPSSETTVIPAEIEQVTGHYISRESYTRLVAEPALFETVNEQIQIAPAGRQANPSAYEAKEEQVLIKPATKYYEYTEPVFETVEAPVEIEPAYMELEVLPMQYEPVVERIEVRPAATRWVRRNVDRDCLGSDPDDCFVWCMVEVPAQYQTIYKQIPRGCDGKGSDDCVRYNPVPAKTISKPLQRVKVPASVSERVAPAEYQTITKWVLRPGATAPAGDGPGEMVTIAKQVLKRPAFVREETVPAEYQTLTRKALKAPARLQLDPVPAAYITITKRVLVRKGGFPEWREILCGEKMTGFTIRQIQEALQALGYFQGTVSGKMDAKTKTAIARFQEERDLPADGNVDFETLKALGIGY